MKQNTLRRATIDRAVIYSEDIINLFLANYRRNKLSNTDFSIISNNCWGGTYTGDIICLTHPLPLDSQMTILNL